MRKLIYSMQVSLDGYIEDTRHSLEWHVVDRELLTFINRQQAEVGTYLWGRRLYENMSAYWPVHGLDADSPDYVQEYAHIYMNIPKVVFSNTLEKVDENSRLVRGDAAAEVARLKTLPGKRLEVGGAGLAGEMIRQDLVDEYRLFLAPVILGGGTPYFPEGHMPLPLKLIETHPFTNGVVLLRYERRREE
jgi:dihydrofolate reductase